MRNSITLFLLFLQLAICAQAADRQDAAASLSELAAAYRQLRTLPGHFNGGRWNQKVDRWQGEKHRIMLQLGERLDGKKSEISRVYLAQLLGPPDLIAYPHEHWYPLLEKLSASKTAETPEVYLLYFWRGEHDLLFFASRNNRILFSDWWHAYE